MQRRFAILDVFTERAFGGNPLAIVLDAEGLEPETMQAIAAEFGFSETAFVVPPTNPAHHNKVRIYTPRAEVPFAGHPTVGTALLLAWQGCVREGELLLLEEEAGLVATQLEWANSRAARAVFTAPEPPSIGERADPAAVAAALGLEPEQLVTDAGLPVDASCGLPFLLVELVDQEALAAAALTGAVQDLSPGSADGIYLFTCDAGGGEVDLRARMFAPGDGIPEDPATGSAAAALAGHLAGRSGLEDGWHAWTIAQGVEMGRPSLITVRGRREGGRAVEVEVGGAAVLVARGELEAV